MRNDRLTTNCKEEGYVKPTPSHAGEGDDSVSFQVQAADNLSIADAFQINTRQQHLVARKHTGAG
jgi:hypothetical protein